MLQTFQSVIPQIKLFYKNVSIDNLAFKFHYRYTFILLLISTVLVTSRQYIGDHISCIVGSGIPTHVINTYCFFTSTFTLVRHLNETLLQKSALPHPGVGPYFEEDTVKRHAYYQWVPFVLFLQAISFYMPHVLWRSVEGGRIKKFVEGLRRAFLSGYIDQDEPVKIKDKQNILPKTEISRKISELKKTFQNYVEFNKFWAYKLMACEILNLLNVLLQIYITNAFLAGQFYQLGFDFIEEDFSGIMDCLDVVFPKITKCDFLKYGPSGSIQKHDALCVMALNVINEKIFVFLWFWYLILFSVSVMALIWRFWTYCLHSISKKFNKALFSFACPGHINPDDIKTVAKHLSFSSWLFLYYLAKNMDSRFFKELLKALAEELRDENASPPFYKKQLPSKIDDSLLEDEKQPLKKRVTFDEADDKRS